MAFGVTDLQFWTLSSAIMLLTRRPHLALPTFASRLLYIVGQASFAIFLLHIIFLRVYTRVFYLEDPDGAWLFALIASTSVWVAAAALRRAYLHQLGELTAAANAWGPRKSGGPD